MNAYTNTKIKKSQGAQAVHVYLANKSKHRVLNDSANRRYEQQSKNITRKSIEINLTQHNKIGGINNIYQTNQSTKPHYRRVSHNFKKGQTRYQQDQRDQTRISSKSPYVRAPSKIQHTQGKELQSRTSALNRSTHKIRSGQLLKQNSPRYFYRQPRSSLSQHYDPSIQHSLHKRKISVVGEEHSDILEQAKQYYKSGSYHRSIEVLKKYIKLHRSSVQGRYLLGMSLINNSEFDLGIDELQYALELNPTFKKSLYLVIALAYKRIEKYDEAITILDKGLKLFPDYYDCMVYRGKLHLKKQNYYHALKDFTEAIKINPQKGFAYVGKGTCEKEVQHYEQAIQSFTQGLSTQMGHICRQKRAGVHYEMGNYTAAIKDLQKCSQSQGQQTSTVHYYKGMIHYKEGRQIDAMLSFEQALKCDNHRQNVTSSVEMMMRIKVQEKDFYEAYHILTRAENVEVNTDVLNEWRLFLEASLFLMKKKYKDGISTFESLLTLPLFQIPFQELKNKPTKNRYCFLKPLIHLYKAFGQLCENHLENAEKQYQQHDAFCKEFKVNSENLSKDYNRVVMKTFKAFPKDTCDLIEQAIQLIPSKPQPYLYMTFDIIRNKFLETEDPIIKNDYLQEAISNLSQGISHLPQLSNNHISTFFFYRSLLFLFKNDFNKAVADVDKAIEKSEDNIPKYFYLRGLIFAVFGNFSQGVQDLTVAINLDEKYSKPYLERAKCLQIEGNSNQAFLDLQRYITLAPEDQNIHKYAGYLLFQNCAYEDCLSAFSHGAQLSNDSELVLTKAKCHFLLGEDELALMLFRKYTDISGSHEYDSDISMIEISRSIRTESTNEEYDKLLTKIDQIISKKTQDDCKIFKLRDMHQIKASIYLVLGDYESAEKEFEQTLKLFAIQKQKQMERHFIEDSEEFEDEWSEVQIKFNLALCYLSRKEYEKAKQMMKEFQNSSEKGRNWNQYMELLEQLAKGKIPTKKIQLATFEQNHRISKQWPKIHLPGTDIHLAMAFSYPFVQPPELMPEFDMDFFQEFDMTKTENKPEAPWINRSQGGLVFTPNVQVYDNLQLSMTTTKKNDSQHNKPVSEMERSQELSHSMLQLQGDDLKRKFKLDSLVELKLNKLMKK